MSRRMVVVDRETPMLMPPSIQEWVGKDDMARFVVDAVEAVEESACRYNWRGSGDEQYSPRMMLALLVYSYAHGVFSSRKIEVATYRDIAVRYICADNHPDHDTIAKFRRENRELFRDSFAQVLQLARELELKRVGEVALDGTMLEAASSRRGVKSKKQLEEELCRLQGRIEGLLEQAEKVDEREAGSGSGSRMPKELAKAQTRQAKLREAMERLKEVSQERHEERERERKAFDREGPGEPPKPLAQEPKEEDTITLGEAQAALLPQKKGGHAPGYNAQIAVQADPVLPLILANGVCQASNDRRQLAPMAKKIRQAAPETGAILVDSGYDNSAQIFAVEREMGAIVYCPPQACERPPAGKQRGARRKTFQYRQAMRACLRSDYGARSQRVRSTTVEPVFSWIKKTMGFQRFSLRGLAKVQTEWDLVCLAFNMALLHRHKPRCS